MSRPAGAAQGGSYDPLPTNHSTPDLAYRDEQDIAASASSTPGYDHLQFDFDPTTMASLERPRFMGTVPGEGPSIRDSVASYNTRPQSTVNSSVYALNPEQPGSARDSPDPRSDFSYRDDPSAPYPDDGTGVPMAEVGSNRYLSEKRNTYAAPAKSKRNLFIIGGIVVAVIIAIAVAVPVAINAKKSSSNISTSGSGNSSSSDPGSSSSGSSPSSTKSTVKTGGDGSTVTMDDGSTFTYSNKFGGTWYFDEDDPFNNAARAQSWSPALNESFNWGVDKIRGVNLGGWLVTEPFIAPALYQKYANANPIAVDEWTLSEAMAADTSSGGGIGQLEDHYKSFITETDFAAIAGAGLNFVRIPIAYWAIETRDGEPFLEKTSWTYFLKAIKWARKYGIRINLDLHSLPGSQNGWNHSGRLGTISMMNGTMGLANAQRSLDYIRIIAEFISQPQYRDVVVMFGVTNEPQASIIGFDNLELYYYQAYKAVRGVSGTGEGNGPMISYHDGFTGVPKWAGFLEGADRIALDYHPYLCFQDQITAPLSSEINAPCTAWGSTMNTSMDAFGMTAAGEWSNAINDCGLFVNGVNLGTRYEGTYTGSWPVIGSCDPWLDYENYNQTTKDNMKAFAMSSMDALQNWFFWTWKIGNSSETGKVEAPAWSYSLGLEQGWIPTDPREAVGACGNSDPWTGSLSAAQTGGAGAGNIAAAVTSSLTWPPASISNADGAATDLPTYTPTGTIVTLPPPTFTASNGSTVDAGNGWFNTADQTSMMVPVATCSYLSPWVESAEAAPPACGTAAAKRADVPPPTITTPPKQ